MKALELRGVEKSFKKRRREVVRALDSISLSVGKGEVVGILGPNGSGKSTLVRVISTLVLPDSGEVEVFGIDATRLGAGDAVELGPVEQILHGRELFEEACLDADPVHAALHPLGMARGVDPEDLDLSRKRATEPMEHLSRGMQQKIALA